MAAYMAALLDEYAREPDVFLSRCPPLAPLPAQERLIQACVDRARRAGLVIPAGVRFHTVSGRGRLIHPGETHHDPATGAITVYLDVEAWPADLERTTLHELQHVADAGAGRRFDRVEWEIRAVEFVARMLGY
jgi:hypothetical protein